MNQSQCLPFSNNHTLPAGGLYSILIYTFFILIQNNEHENRETKIEKTIDSYKIIYFCYSWEGIFFLVACTLFFKKITRDFGQKKDHWIYSLQNQPA